jgi:hypothetical protein
MHVRPIFLAALALALAGGTAVYAANTQVSPSAFKAAGPKGYIYGRSDGVFHEATSKSPYIVENGTSSGPLAAGYRETFAYGDGKGVTQLDSGGGGACAGNTTTVPCLATFGSGVKLAWFPAVTATLELDMDASGLDISSDVVDNDGLEVAGGILGASGRPFIIGDDPAFYFCATIYVDDVSGTDDLHIGFRRPSAFTATFDDYLDLATIGLVGASGDIQIETIDDNAATTTTDTTDNMADDETKKFCVYVSGAGVVTYKVDGNAPTATAAFTFDDGDPVIPFVHYLHATTSPDELILSLWEVGYQEPHPAPPADCAEWFCQEDHAGNIRACECLD